MILLVILHSLLIFIRTRVNSMPECFNPMKLSDYNPPVKVPQRNRNVTNLRAMSRPLHHTHWFRSRSSLVKSVDEMSRAVECSMVPSNTQNRRTGSRCFHQPTTSAGQALRMSTNTRGEPRRTTSGWVKVYRVLIAKKCNKLIVWVL